MGSSREQVRQAAGALNRCIFVLVGACAAQESVRGHRLERLGAWFAPLSPVLSLHEVPALTACVGQLSFAGAPEPDVAASASWGEPLPPGLETNIALLEASGADLRNLAGCVVAIAADAGRIRIVTSPDPPTTMFESPGPDTWCWSTHAVAAAILATGHAEIEPDSIPELIGAEFVGSERTLLRNVRALPPASRVEIKADGIDRGLWRSTALRWQGIPASEARSVAEESLLSDLATRTQPFERVGLGLTAGIDSRMVAVALRELGVPFKTYFRGAGPEFAKTQDLASALGAEHELVEFDFWQDDEIFRQADRVARWHEGTVPMGLGQPRPPTGIDADITGNGGETARAYYYADVARFIPEPSRSQLAGRLRAVFEPRLAGATEGARVLLEQSIDQWLTEASESGHSGWRLLDVLYREQRMQRWGRSFLPLQAQPMLWALSGWRFSAAAVSLPLSERATDGLARRFVAERAPEIAFAHTPQFARAGRAARVRYSIRELLLGRRRRSQPPWGRPSAFAGLWLERPRFQSWIAERVLGDGIVAEALGERWASSVRAAFLAGDADAEKVATRAAGITRFADALSEWGES